MVFVVGAQRGAEKESIIETQSGSLAFRMQSGMLGQCNILVRALLILVLFTVVRSHNPQKNFHVDSTYTYSDCTFVAYFGPFWCDRPYSLFNPILSTKFF